MNKLFNIDLTETNAYNSAKDIIEEQCGYLGEDTDGMILGKVEDYSGEIQNYRRVGTRSPMKALALLWKDEEDEEIDIQTQLGELSEGVFTYDFFISSKYTPNYKYRVMFFRYGIGGYPVQVVIDDKISEEIMSGPDLSCKTEKEFNEFLSKVFATKKFTEVIKNLLAYNKKFEIENADSLPF